ncbi:histidine phosphatase family protein [Henriciella aquimarina]|uniref:histidine phosphatase family protein n=1 Tax=Henriciella aquimarina TaxID=545261 RepID=UPI000A07A9F0|nr:histidine phosphatase family protein [Henriciella aquimarina]
MICLVRHGEAAAGWGHAADPGLSPLGEKQAEAVTTTLKAAKAERIVASPMARCQQTSLPFAHESGLAVATDRTVGEIPTPDGLEDRVAWLREFMAGSWSNAPALLKGWREDLIRTIETMPDHTVVFTHFVAINTIVGHLGGSQNVTSFRPGHCSVTWLAKGADRLVVEQLGSEAATKIL